MALNATDRCDRCMAQAVVTADSIAWLATLLFCYHCYRESERALSQLEGVIIADHRGEKAVTW